MQLSLDAAMERTFTVGEFASLVNEVLQHTFPHELWIQGEVRDLNRARSGHVYFTLVDPTDEVGRSADASLNVVLFEQTKHQVNAHIKRTGNDMRIDDGVAVRLRGTPEFYAPQGRLNLRMTGIDPAYTIGQMAASRDRLLRALAEEGLLGRNGATTIPMVPMRVGLVTAPNSAAHADFVEELTSSGFAFDVRLASCAVQGAGAAGTIAGAIQACVAQEVDVTAVVRGGGGRMDLVAFDDEVVARAIAGCPIPVITGIGHEIDAAVADEVSHTSLKTPTACAAFLVARVDRADRETDRLWAAINAAAAQRVVDHQTRVAVAARRAGERVAAVLGQADLRTAAAANRARDLATAQLARADQRLQSHMAEAQLQVRHRLDIARSHVDRTGDRVGDLALRHLRDAQHAIDSADTHVRLLDPARALARGWSITTDAAGAVVRSVTDAAPGTTIRTRLADGTLTSTVDDAQPTEPAQEEQP